MNIVFCSSEVFPFTKTGGLADVCGTLPLALERRGIKVSIVTPRYKSIDAKKFPLERVNKDYSLGKIGKNISVYFIEHDEYFDRDGLYGNKKGDYEDNLERFMYFCKKTLELFKKLKIKVDILHCHDWQTALIPAYLKFLYAKDSFYQGTKSILTIHNLAYQGLFPERKYLKLGLPENLYGIDGFEFYGKINLLKGGIIFSDTVTTVSKTYAKEIQTETLGSGLEGVLRHRKSITGILNGIDSSEWNPKADPFIAKAYSPEDFSEKSTNKRKLQNFLKLPVDTDIPLFGFVGRLSHQKGIDLIDEALGDIGKLNVQIAFLGTGEECYQRVIQSMMERFPKKISAHFHFDEPKAHQVYAGSDFFLIPSIYEPCGLSQMISLKYGTIPVAYKTGGLAETVFPFNAETKEGNGFVFETYEKNSFMKAMKDAVSIYQNKKVFSELVKKAFSYDFSWDASAKEYEKLYKQCVS